MKTSTSIKGLILATFFIGSLPLQAEDSSLVSDLETTWENLRPSSDYLNIYSTLFVEGRLALEPISKEEACNTSESTSLIDTNNPGDSCDEDSGDAKFYNLFSFPISASDRSNFISRNILLNRMLSKIEKLKDVNEDSPSNEDNPFGDIFGEKEESVANDIWFSQRYSMAQMELTLLYLARYQDSRDITKRCQYISKANNHKLAAILDLEMIDEKDLKIYTALKKEFTNATKIFKGNLENKNICKLGELDRVKNQMQLIESRANEIIKNRINSFIKAQASDIEANETRINSQQSKIEGVQLKSDELFSLENNIDNLSAQYKFLKGDRLSLTSNYIPKLEKLDLEKIFGGVGPDYLPTWLRDQKVGNREALRLLEKHLIDMEGLAEDFKSSIEDSQGQGNNGDLTEACQGLSDTILSELQGGEKPTEKIAAADDILINEAADFSIISTSNVRVLDSQIEARSIVVAKYDTCVQKLHGRLGTIEPNQELSTVIMDFARHLKALSETLTNKILK